MTEKLLPVTNGLETVFPMEKDWRVLTLAVPPEEIYLTDGAAISLRQVGERIAKIVDMVHPNPWSVLDPAKIETVVDFVHPSKRALFHVILYHPQTTPSLVKIAAGLSLSEGWINRQSILAMLGRGCPNVNRKKDLDNFHTQLKMLRCIGDDLGFQVIYLDQQEPESFWERLSGICQELTDKAAANLFGGKLAIIDGAFSFGQGMRFKLNGVVDTSVFRHPDSHMQAEFERIISLVEIYHKGIRCNGRFAIAGSPRLTLTYYFLHPEGLTSYEFYKFYAVWHGIDLDGVDEDQYRSLATSARMSLSLLRTRLADLESKFVLPNYNKGSQTERQRLGLGSSDNNNIDTRVGIQGVTRGEVTALGASAAQTNFQKGQETTFAILARYARWREENRHEPIVDSGVVGFEEPSRSEAEKEKSGLRRLDIHEQKLIKDIYEQYYLRLVSFAMKRLGGNRQLAEDIVADTFSVISQSRDDSGNLRIQGIDNLGAYLISAVHNGIRTWYKWGKDRHETYFTEEIILPDEKPRGQEDAVLQQIVVEEGVYQFIGQNARQKPRLVEILVLYWLSGFEIVEIAQYLGIEVGTVRAHRNQARKKLAGWLKKQT